MRLRLYKYLKSAFQQHNPSRVHARTHAPTALLTHTHGGENLKPFPSCAEILKIPCAW